MTKESSATSFDGTDIDKKSQNGLKKKEAANCQSDNISDIASDSLNRTNWVRVRFNSSLILFKKFLYSLRVKPESQQLGGNCN